MTSADLKDEITAFLTMEADYADEWALDAWMALWAEGEVAYEVGPLNMGSDPSLTYDKALFLISDNRFRLEHRVQRLGKPDAHAEWPVRSRIRHVYSHLRHIVERGDEIDLRVNMLITRVRTSHDGVNIIPGIVYFTLVRTSNGLKMSAKRVFLDLQTLSNPGTLTYLA